MFFSRLLVVLVLLHSTFAHAAEALFGADGKRVWITTQSDSLGYLDVDDREPTTASDRQLLLKRDGNGPTIVQSIALSEVGNLLLAAPDAVWAFNPATDKIVKVATMPVGFGIGDIAYQETTGAIFVSGWFTSEDTTIKRAGAFRVAKGSDKPQPVLISGIDSIQAVAFDKKGQLFIGAGPDLWGGDLAATEHESADEYPWQFRGFRLAALGTPMSGEGADADQVISSVAAGGERLIITMRGSEGGTILGLSIPVLPRHKEGAIDRLLPLKARWAFQQKVTGSIQFITPADALPNLPIVSVSADGTRIVYQTAAPSLRRWWIIEKAGKPRMLREESD